MRLPLSLCLASCGLLPLDAAPSHGAERPIVVVTAPLTRARPAIAAAMAAAVSASADAGTSFTVETVDDACSETVARRAATDVATRVQRKEPIVAVIGHPCASAARAAAPIYQAARIVFLPVAPFLAPAADRDAAGGHTLVLLDGRQSEGAYLAGLAMAFDQAGSRVAIVADATRAMREIASDAAAALRAAGVSEPLIEILPAGTRDLAGVSRRIAAAGATRIVLATFPPEAWLLVSALSSSGSSLQIYAAAAVAAEAAPASLPKQATANVRVARRPLFAADLEANADAAAARAGGLTAIALQFLAAALQTAGPDADHVIDFTARLREVTVSTPAGPVRFDPSGRTDLPSWELVAWDGRRWAASR